MLPREPGCTLFLAVNLDPTWGWWWFAGVWGVWGCRPFLRLLPDALAGCARSAHSCLVGHTLQEGAQCVPFFPSGLTYSRSSIKTPGVNEGMSVLKEKAKGGLDQVPPKDSAHARSILGLPWRAGQWLSLCLELSSSRPFGSRCSRQLLFRLEWPALLCLPNAPSQSPGTDTWALSI